jgi:hypothetical protein
MLAEVAAGLGTEVTPRSRVVVREVVLVEHDVAGPKLGAHPRDRFVSRCDLVHRGETSRGPGEQRTSIRLTDDDDVVGDE